MLDYMSMSADDLFADIRVEYSRVGRSMDGASIWSHV